MNLFTFIFNFNFFVFCCIGQSMVGDGKWHLVPSYEDATILIRNYEKNTVTKFSCFTRDKGFGRIGMRYYDNLFTYGSEFKLQ